MCKNILKMDNFNNQDKQVTVIYVYGSTLRKTKQQRNHLI